MPPFWTVHISPRSLPKILVEKKDKTRKAEPVVNALEQQQWMF